MREGDAGGTVTLDPRWPACESRLFIGIIVRHIGRLLHYLRNVPEVGSGYALRRYAIERREAISAGYFFRRRT